MKVSILVPTRKRAQSLRASIRSLEETMRSSELEVLIALDDDDAETIEDLSKDPIPNSHMIVGPRVGYINLHLYVNALCSMATGDWLFLWNDDSLMQTEGWDEVLDSYTGQMVVVNPQTNHGNHALANCIFPIIPRQMFEVLGHFSLSNHNDTYVENIANALSIRRDAAIYVLHDRADFTGANNDEVYHEREFTTGAFYGAENMSRIREDIEKLRPYVTPAVETSA